MLLGRERECSQIDLLIEQARARSSAALVIRGDPGIGKSALLAYAVERADTMRVLRATGVRSESELPFAALHELLRPALGHIDGLPEPQRSALRGALALGPPASADRLAVHAAVLALLADAAEASSLLCVVDDAHWLDPASAEALLFCARRLHAEGILMLLAARDMERRRFDAPGIPELVLEGLDHDASSELVERGTVTLAPSVIEQLIRLTRGNPLGLIELPAELNRDQRTGREPLGGPLPVGKGIKRAFRGRVHALSATTQAALVVAAASDTPDLRTIGQALRELGAEVRDLEEAESAGLVAIVDGEVVFYHPLVRSAIYRTADPALLRAAHRALADTRHDNIGSRAWHLAAAATEPSEEVAQALERAAAEAHSRGAPEVAALSYERAAALTPGDEDRAKRLLAAGTESWLAGRCVQALEQLDEALDAAKATELRADIQLQRGRALTWTSNVTNVHALLVQEAERVAPTDPARAALMLSEVVINCCMAGQIAKGVEHGRRAEKMAEHTPAQLPAAAVLAIADTLHGEPGSQARLASCLDALDAVDLPESYPLVSGLAHTLMMVEDFDRAQAALDRVVGARERGIVNLFALAARSELNFRLGSWTVSYADGAEAVQAAREAGQPSMLPFCLVMLARVEAATGREADCREHIAQAIKFVVPLGVEAVLSYAESVLGLLELGLGQPDRAIEHLERVSCLLASQGVAEPGTVQFAPDLIEAYARSGRASEAEVELAGLVRAAQSTGRAWARATAARCRGIMTSDAAFDAEFQEALAWHDRIPMPFEQARTQLTYGERLRRAGRRIDAREQLRSALTTFERLGAEPWAARTRAELGATGERLRRTSASVSSSLTAQELQVATLVAAGATNREAGTRLLLSPRTIEFHLRNAYAKLGVRSRTELAARIARGSKTGASIES